MQAVDDTPVLARHLLTVGECHVPLLIEVAGSSALITATETSGPTPVAALPGVTLDLAGVLVR